MLDRMLNNVNANIADLMTIDTTATDPEVLSNEIETIHASTLSVPNKNWNEVKGSLKNYISMATMAEKLIAASKEQCDRAEELVETANNYEAKWYKIGSTRKKQNLMSDAQLSMQQTVSSLQKAQALSFTLQRELAKFCAILLQFSRQNEQDCDKISKILDEIVQSEHRTYVSQEAIENINTLYTTIQEEKKIRQLNQANKSGKMTTIFMGVIIVLLGIIAYLLMK